MSDFGITPEGYNRKRVEDIRAELQADMKVVFGDDLDVSEESNAGALIDMLTKKFADIWDAQEEDYNSRDGNGAEGISLDRIVQFVGVTRKAADATTFQGILKGDIGTVIGDGNRVSQDISLEEFLLLEEVSLLITEAIQADISVDTVVDSTVYTVTLNLTNYTINSGVGATEESIIAALKVDVDSGSDPVVFTDNLDGTADISADDGVTDFSISVTSNLSIDKLSNLGQFAAENDGPISVPTSSINTIVTPVSGWDSIANTQAGITGEDIETDEELRIRRRTALLGIGSGSDPAIEANILNEVDDVSSVKVISNRTSGVVDLRPAKSFEAIVTGGADQDVFDKIWEVQPSGIESYGNTVGAVVDSNGDTQVIKFSRPADRYIWIRYTLELYDEEVFPSNGEELIKTEVIVFGEENYTPGVDVIKDRLTQPVYSSVDGVGNMVIELAVTTLPTDIPSYGSANIAIAEREIAAVDTDRITVLIP